MIRGDQQEKNQDVYKARGHVEIRFRQYILHSDEATYDSTSGRVTATGHVVFDGGPHNEHIESTHGTYDVSRDTGTFYDATGSTGVRVKNKMMFLTSSTPFFFAGKVIEKLGPDQYRVNHGYVTSCQLKKPNWQLNSETANIDLGDEARLHHSTLRIRGFPLFYFPYMQHPADNWGRQSGFLIPMIGQSNSRGLILGDGFYWAINRNSDATLGFEYFSERGWAQHGEYRSLGYKYSIQGEYYGVDDTKGIPAGQPGAGTKEGGQEIKLNGHVDLPWDFHGVISLDYLSSYIFRLAFAQSFIQAVSSEVRSSGFLFKNWDGYSFGTLVSRYQNFQSTQPNDYISIYHSPSFDFSSVERPIFDSRFTYAYDAAAEGVSRSEPGFSTPLTGRLDANPKISLPSLFRGWALRPELGVRETYYTARLLPASGAAIGTAVETPINRNVLQASMEIRPPSVAKIFEHKPFGYVYKHVIEPRVVYRYQTGIDNFSQILRFDERDILADTNEVEYGVINRLYAKKSSSDPNCFNRPRYLDAGDPVPADQLPDGTLISDPTGTIYVIQGGKRRLFPNMETFLGLGYSSGQVQVITATEIAAIPVGESIPTLSTTARSKQARLLVTAGKFQVCDDKSGPAREIITWELAQKYFMNPTFGGALVPGTRNVFDSTVDLTGIAFLTEPRVFSPIVSRLRASAAGTDFSWALDYDPVLHQVNDSTIFVSRGWKNWVFGGGETYLNAVGEVSSSTNVQDIFNQYRVLVQWGNVTKRGANSAFQIGWDARLGYVQYVSSQTTYNWDCCGITFEYKRFALGTVRNENFYKFALSLTNFGTFGNLRQIDRLY